MTKEEMLKGDSKELYPSLYYLIMSHPQNGTQIIEEFMDYPRYQQDPYFKLAVDSASLVANGLIGRHDYIIAMAPDVIEKAISLKHWKLVSTNWNNLGTTYATLLILEKALECYCHVINVEKQHGSKELISMAYYNLSSLLYDVGAHEKALAYIEKAVDSFDEKNESSGRMFPRYLLYLTLHLQLLCRMGRMEKAKCVYDILLGAFRTGSFRESLFSFRVAEMYYFFYSGDRSDCRAKYERIMELVDERDLTRKYLVIEAFVELCEEFSVEYSHYEDLLIEVDGMPEIISLYTMSRLYGWLRKYYMTKGKIEAANRVTPIYIEYMEKNQKFHMEQKRHSLETVESLLLVKTSTDVRNKTVELKLLADEAIKNKHALEAAYKKLEKMSSMDPLTHISSRRDFENRFIGLINEAKQEEKSVLVFMLDIDHFKLYNDSYGHLEGDEVLKKVAVIFRDNLEKVHGLAARFGGEEFIGACTGLSSEEGRSLAQAICNDIRNLNLENKAAFHRYVTASIGVARGYDVVVENRSQMMKLADISLYEAKSKGRNTVVLKEFHTIN